MQNILCRPEFAEVRLCLSAARRRRRDVLEAASYDGTQGSVKSTNSATLVPALSHRSSRSQIRLLEEPTGESESRVSLSTADLDHLT